MIHTTHDVNNDQLAYSLRMGLRGAMKKVPSTENSLSNDCFKKNGSFVHDVRQPVYGPDRKKGFIKDFSPLSRCFHFHEAGSAKKIIRKVF